MAFCYNGDVFIVADMYIFDNAGTAANHLTKSDPVTKLKPFSLI